MTEPVHGRGRHTGWLLAIVVVAGLFGCCGGLTLIGGRPKNGIRVEKLEADLRSSLPVGSMWAQAEAWFASHGIEPMGIRDLNGKEVGLGAIIPNDSFLESAEIYLYVYFNDAGEVREIIIYRFVYFL